MIQMPLVGTINNMMRMQKLNMKWQQRKENPNLAKGNEEDPQIAQLRKEAEQVRKSSVIASIDAKLKAGGKLSSEELDYLRLNSPELYKEAMEVAMEREQYRKSLENCKTKEDVERVKTNRVQSCLSQVKSINANPNIPIGKKTALLEQITRRIMGIQSEHITFTSKPQYANLPREAELLDEKEKRKKKPIAEIHQDEAPEKLHFKQDIKEDVGTEDSVSESTDSVPSEHKKPSQTGTPSTIVKKDTSPSGGQSAAPAHVAAPTTVPPVPTSTPTARPSTLSLRA